MSTANHSPHCKAGGSVFKRSQSKEAKYFIRISSFRLKRTKADFTFSNGEIVDCMSNFFECLCNTSQWIVVTDVSLTTSSHDQLNCFLKCEPLPPSLSYLLWTGPQFLSHTDHSSPLASVVYKLQQSFTVFSFFRSFNPPKFEIFLKAFATWRCRCHPF